MKSYIVVFEAFGSKNTIQFRSKVQYEGFKRHLEKMNIGIKFVGYEIEL